MFHSLHCLLRTRWRTSLACSSAVHFALAVLVVAELLALFLPSMPQSSALQLEAATFEVPSSPPLIDFETGPSGPWMAESATDLSELIASADDPRWQEALLEGQNPPKPAAESSQFITSQLLEAIAAAEQRSDEANLERLETLTGALEAGSSAKSVEQLTASLQSWLGTEQRATKPADEPVAGEFDLATAQLHDVVRDDSTGEVRYTAVLLDAAGRTMESPLTQAEGESVYRVMQLMKENPLLERVYRGVVLSFLDKLLAQSGARKAESGD